jgi:GNAT superfamily N-acetyltransferase
MREAIEPVEGYEIDTDPGRVDIDVVHAWLTRSYWARGIPRSVVERSLRGSLVWGVYQGTRQVGFARVITDKATFAWLCDVFVVEEHQGRGLGPWLMRIIRQHPDLQGLRRFLLATRDAHGLYEKVGFQRLAAPERFMEIVDPEIYLRMNQEGPRDATPRQ